MAKRAEPAPRTVCCPTCLDTFLWDETGLHEFFAGQYRPLDLSAVHEPRKRADRLRTAYKLCPNPSGDAPGHYIPASYATYPDPIRIGLVGDTRSGKTHLLAAMIGEIEGGALQPFKINAAALDVERHKAFLHSHVHPLLTDGVQLRWTELDVIEFADALILTSAETTRLVLFYDVAGEDLTKTGRPARFVAAVDALIFVVDPVVALPDALGENGTDGRAGQRADRAFGVVLDRLRHRGGALDVAAAIAVAKSDMLRFTPPVDQWLRAPLQKGRFDERLVMQESRDAYAFLYAHGATGWLRPFHDTRHCTLHFVSATGADPRDGRLPRGARPQRVLTPLLSVLAATGVLPAPAPEVAGT
jgi:hypothetical protein